jgi:hypothetical protein
MSTKSSILQNQFLHKLRTELAVDRKEFENLCDNLRVLKAEWTGKSLIDKQLAQELYVLCPVTKGVADSLRGHAPALAAELDELAVVLDALVIDCFSQ